MRSIPIWFIATVVCAAMATTIAAQTRGALNRKIITKVAPVYPELAKHMNIGGSVKMEVVIRPNGSVKSTKIVGGNPVLLDSAKQAVLKWKFAASSEETTGIVEVLFASQ
ncbi:MAG: energy transducer TonB [Candidatus Sulfotelmatobacter sp.]